MNSAWANLTVEHRMREIVRTAETVLNDGRKSPGWWIVILPATLWILKTACRQRLGIRPFRLCSRDTRLPNVFVG